MSVSGLVRRCSRPPNRRGGAVGRIWRAAPPEATIEVRTESGDVNDTRPGRAREWSRLNHMQLGRYAEYLVMMEFTASGFDVYRAEVDDKGIDFVIRQGPDTFYDVQVKSVRRLNYVFMRKSKFQLRPNCSSPWCCSTMARSPTCIWFPPPNGSILTASGGPELRKGQVVAGVGHQSLPNEPPVAGALPLGSSGDRAVGNLLSFPSLLGRGSGVEPLDTAARL